MVVLNHQINDDEYDSIFGVMTSNEITLQGLMNNELFLFSHLKVILENEIPFELVENT
jgi:hypothetical protein